MPSGEEKMFAEVEYTEFGPRVKVGEKTFEAIGVVFATRDHLNTAHSQAVSAAVREAYERAASLLDGLADISDGAITDKALRAGSKAIRALAQEVK